MTCTMRFGVMLFVLLLISPTSGWAHAYLVKSSPARRAVLSNAPARVVLWFNDAKKLSVGIPTLPAGSYSVKFRVLSVDGHIVEAEFPFSVRGHQ
jgi:methionine-rich copper-binding protein CopC